MWFHKYQQGRCNKDEQFRIILKTKKLSYHLIRHQDSSPRVNIDGNLSIWIGKVNTSNVLTLISR